MLKKALVATAAGLSILPVALAATITFTDIFGAMIKFFGPSGTDFLMAFGIVAAVVFMAISRLPLFEESSTGRAGSAMFAILGGLATAFYVYMQKIPFLQLIGPYFIFLLAIMLGLLAVQVFTSWREGVTFAGKAAMVGLGGIIIGVILLFFAPTLATLAILILFIGIVAFFVAGISWAGGFRWTTQIWKEERLEEREEREEAAEEVIDEEELAAVEKELSEGKPKMALKTLKKAIKQLKKIDKDVRKEQKSVSRQYTDIAEVYRKFNRLLNKVPSEYAQTYTTRLENLEQEERNAIAEKEKLIEAADKDLLEAFELLEKGDERDAYNLIRKAVGYGQEFLEIDKTLEKISNAKNNIETQIRNLLKGQNIKA